MRIKHLKLDNFCSFYNGKAVDTDLYNKTEVSGCNESGKSTVKRAIFWVLNCRGENGEEITGIRPHDKSGNEINDIEVTVEMTVELNGSSKTFKKVSRQSYNKKGDFIGNVIDYYINNIPKKKCDYEDFIAEKLVPVSELSNLINAKTLLSKSAADCRSILESTFGTCSNAEVCEHFPEFFPLLPLLDDGSVDELKSKFNTMLNGRRGRNGTKGLLDIRKEFPSRIDEVKKQKIVVDEALINSQIADIESRLKDNQSKQADVQKAFDEQRAIQAQIYKLKQEQLKVTDDANAENRKRIADLDAQIMAAREELFLSNSSLNAKEHELHQIDSEIRDLETKRLKLSSDWKSNKDMQFDENLLICPYCKREYPSDQQDEMRKHFEESKEEMLQEITDDGMKCKEAIDALREKFNAADAELSTLREESNKKSRVVDDLVAQKKAISTVPPAEPDEAAKARSAEIAKLESQLEANTANATFAQLKAEENSLQDQLSSLKAELAKTEINVKIDARVAELNIERRKNEQLIADTQAQLDLLKRFNIRKHELLESKVNEYLEYCQVKFFRQLVNGDLEETCDFCVNGEPYARNLNHGAKILIETDVCKAFQKKYATTLPIIVDDSESVDNWKIPDMDRQLIILKRTDSKELTIKES